MLNDRPHIAEIRVQVSDILEMFADNINVSKILKNDNIQSCLFSARRTESFR
jgi:uncharacterized protein (DUF433 family)